MENRRVIPLVFLLILLLISTLRVMDHRIRSAVQTGQFSSSQKLEGYVLEHPYIKNDIKVIPLGSEKIYVDKNTPVYLGEYIKKVEPLDKVTSSQNSEWSGFVPKLSSIQIDESRSIKPLVGLSILRENKIGEVKKQMKFPYSSIMLGLTIGYKEDFPYVVSDMIRRSGLSHIFVVSGYNIQLFLDLIRRIFSRFGKPMFLFVSINFLLLYSLIVGFDAPVVRASLMGLFSIFGYLTGRHKTSLYVFFLVVGFLVSYYPAYYEDLGFLLSVSATYAVLIYNVMFSESVNRNFGTFFLALTVNVFIAPVTILYFGVFNPTGILSAVVSSYVVEWVTLSGFIMLIFPTRIVEYVLLFLCDYILRVVEIASSFKFLYFEVPYLKSNWYVAIFLFCALHLLLLIVKRAMNRRRNEI